MLRNIVSKIKNNNRLIAGAAAVGSLGLARAADPDTSAITAAAASVAVIGAAVLAVKVGVRAWKWMASAL